MTKGRDREAEVRSARLGVASHLSPSNGGSLPTGTHQILYPRTIITLWTGSATFSRYRSNFSSLILQFPELESRHPLRLRSGPSEFQRYPRPQSLHFPRPSGGTSSKDFLDHLSIATSAFNPCNHSRWRPTLLILLPFGKSRFTLTSPSSHRRTHFLRQLVHPSLPSLPIIQAC